MWRKKANKKKQTKLMLHTTLYCYSLTAKQKELFNLLSFHFH